MNRPMRPADDRPTIQGRVVDDTPEPAYYVPEMTRPRKALLWLLTSEAGLTLLCIAVIGGAFVAYRFFGWAALTFVLGLGIGWPFGYWIAQRTYVDTGHVPKL